jgi:hypothetical protein
VPPAPAILDCERWFVRRVAGFLATFAGLSFIVYVVTDPT